MKDNRTKNIMVRLTEKEYAQILQEMEKREMKTISAYARLCMLSPLHNENDHYKKELHRLAFVLSRVGNHLGQINRKMELKGCETDYLVQVSSLKNLEETVTDVQMLIGNICKFVERGDTNGDYEVASSEAVQGNPIKESEELSEVHHGSG